MFCAADALSQRMTASRKRQNCEERTAMDW
nr:MAG TPA: hypothetical protein [Caudoviricetes sp.]